MKRKTISFIVLLLEILLIPSVMHAQWVDPDKGVVIEPTSLEKKLVRYGNLPVSLFTGQADVSIPLYEYADYEFTLPVALKHIFTGLQPNEPSGSFGLGWILQAGGCITRQINHYPDEMISSDPKSENSQWGFYQMRLSQTVPDFDCLIDLIGSESYDGSQNLYYETSAGHIETEPDIFSFSMPGHSGKFMFWGNDQIKVFETSGAMGTYKIEPILQNTKFHGFRIITKNGYIYTFGCNDNYDISSDIRSYDFLQNQWLSDYDNPRVSWPLVSITAPSGRILRFEYEKGEQHIGSARPISILTEKRPDMNDSGILKWGHVAKLHLQQRKNLYLKSIVLDEVIRYDFTYGAEVQREKMIALSTSPTYVYCYGLLTKVTVRDLYLDRDIREINLTYMYGSPNQVPLLKEARFSDIGYYNMEYALGVFPYQGSLAVDHWGYYNGQNGNTLSTYLPRTSYYGNDETILSTNRNASESHTMTGALLSISYPTRGKTRFSYELNDYSHSVKKSDAQGGIPLYRENEKSPAGGLRIKEILDLDYNPVSGLCTDTLSYRRFVYGSEEESSGILVRVPRYQTEDINYNANVQLNDLGRYVLSPSILECIDTDYHMEYRNVSEIKADGSICRTNFTAYDLYPDNSNSLFYYTPLGIYGDGVARLLMRPQSAKHMRGALRSKSYFKPDENISDNLIPVKTELFQYKDHGDTCWITQPTRLYFYQRYILANNRILSSIRTTEFGNEEESSSTTSYEYDQTSGYPTQIRIDYPDGKSIRQTIFYSTESQAPHYMTSWPDSTKTEVRKTRDDSYEITEAHRYGYISYRTQPWLTIPRMHSHYSTHLTSAKAAVTDSDYWLEDSLTVSATRVLQHKDRAGRTVTFLFGKHGVNLLAVIRNVDQNTVMNAIDNPGILDSCALTQSQETAIRSIPGAEVTTYRYTPSEGLIQSVDPSGLMTSYSYDEKYRLENIHKGEYMMPLFLDSTFRYIE